MPKVLPSRRACTGGKDGLYDTPLYEQEAGPRERSFGSMGKGDELTEVSPRSMGYQKLPSPNDMKCFPKNAGRIAISEQLGRSPDRIPDILLRADGYEVF